MPWETIALLAALPWMVLPVVSAIRLRDSRSLDEFPAEVPPDAPLVSVIIPARNEERNIGRCVRSVLGTAYPDVEVIVVDDQSTDRTRELLTALQRNEPRLLVFGTEPLPRGWFGKQWACWTGAAKAKGKILCFTEADTEHAPDLLPRSVNALRARGADLFTVLGRQEMVTIWEKLVQPMVFGVLHTLYGGTEEISRSRQAWRKIANGQYLMIPRAAYDETGGHEAVRHTVAEDLLLAQRFHRLGKRVVFMTARGQLATRMYTSLRELVEGWGKNVYAGGMHAMPPVPFGRALFPVFLLLPWVFLLAPVVALAAGAAGLTSGAVLLWAIAATAATLLSWTVIYMDEGYSPLLGLLYPVGGLLGLYIFLRATLRGRRVEWKGREYRAA